MKNVFKIAGVLPFLAISGCTTMATSTSSSLPSQDVDFYTAAYQLVHFDLQECDYYKQNYPAQTAQLAVFNTVCADAAQYAPVLQADAAKSGVTLPDTLPLELRQQLVVATYKLGSDPVSELLQAEISSHVNSLAVFQVEARDGTDPTAKSMAQATEPLVAQNLTALRAAAESNPPQ